MQRINIAGVCEVLLMKKTSRVGHNKTYYVFFNMGGKYDGCYARIKTTAYERARAIAYSKYGYQYVGSIERNEEYAINKVNAYRLVEVD